jgi:hypothetical protein
LLAGSPDDVFMAKALEKLKTGSANVVDSVYA